MTVSTSTLVFLVVVGLVGVSVALLLVWKLAKMALKVVLVGGLLLLLAAAAAIVLLGTSR